MEYCLKQSCVSSVMFCSETICSFYFWKRKDKDFYYISTVLSLSFCTVRQNRFFCIGIFNWDLEKVSIVRRCLLRTVYCMGVSLQGLYMRPIRSWKNCPLEGVRYRGCPLQRGFTTVCKKEREISSHVLWQEKLCSVHSWDHVGIGTGEGLLNPSNQLNQNSF